LKFINAGQSVAQEKEIRLTLEFPFSQANFFDLIPRNCLSYFIEFFLSCICVLHVFLPATTLLCFYSTRLHPLHLRGPGTLAAKPASYRMLCDLAPIPVIDSTRALIRLLCEA
jgi:hypothetical protein